MSLLLLAPALPCQAVWVENVGLWSSRDITRVIFSLSHPTDYHLFKLTDPDRVVIDLRNTRPSKLLTRRLPHDQFLARIRHGIRNNNELRLVLDLHQTVEAKSFLLGPNGKYGHRLVVELVGKTKVPPKRVYLESKETAVRDLLVAIDAGHGGEDPGAKGSRGTQEKDVVLAIAHRLGALVEQEPGMRAVLIRNDDRYIRLRDRIKKARAYQADLFISLHADAVRDLRAEGSSVYVLSERGASSEAARLLAERENASDLIGGVSLDDKDHLLRSVLIDLSQSAVLEASIDVATRVLNRLNKVGKVHRRHVQRAGFVVLKSPDIPSILVEMAFISNPYEEIKLINPRHQQALASALMDGIRDYFRHRAPPGTLFAKRNGLITQVETSVKTPSAIR